ncbi:hypothetical protein [Sneathiella chinensis]|uniref:OmpA-like domain-containing protein n=1 Tax=Sneathiella chinensis TaxID=349750 RepID=A0ABQ5U0X0_9PROT|nr:hypothetical protein [Sneathiella chinensis]GLQ05468.1 hypothetical protein GCM10007924_06890 [Sneathiella chinensis]
MPALTGDEANATAEGQPVQIQPSEAENNPDPTVSGAGAPPALGSTNFVTPGVTPAPNTGTFVGQKVAVLRGELSALQERLQLRNQQLQQIRTTTTANSQAYHGTVAAINTRLQVGTTPGNPVLINQWNQAQLQLERIAGDISSMNSLANAVASDSSMSAYLLESTRAAYGLSGAIEEDHRQLAILEDETNRTVVLVDRILNELSEDISRQTTYIANERSNLTTLSHSIKNGELLGASLGSRAYLSTAPVASTSPVLGTGTRSFDAGNRQPLVVIRFDRADVPYEQALYTAVNRTLQSRPQSVFDVVAISPMQGGAANVALNQTKATRNAQRVLRSLTDMGLPASRVSLSASSSNQAASNEVHIYVR